jgi:hypothetical protein
MFKIGQNVKYKTNRGRAGSGVIEQVRSTPKGAWIDIIDNKDGNFKVSCRPVNVKLA